MDEPDRQRSWYQRPILPPWFPAWLVACLAAGAITCVAFHFGLGGLSGRGLAYCFGGGFVFALLILSLAAGRASPSGDIVAGELAGGWSPQSTWGVFHNKKSTTTI